MKRCVLALCTTLLLVTPAPYAASASTISESYTPEDVSVNSTKEVSLRPSEVEALYPMSSDAEAAIVHVVPAVPVIIDGVRYEAEEINRFDGQRLRFTVDKGGVLHAFTTVEELEVFVEREYGPVFDPSYGAIVTSTGLTVSRFHIDMFYLGGEPLGVPPGTKLPYLGTFNNAISSAQICDSRGVTLYEYENYGGSSYYLPPGSSWTMLTFQGWNDRASSLQG